jgi:hypothetical protein
MYTHTTLAQFRDQLASRLQDPTNQFWTNAGLYPELNSIIAEALRTWQLLTGYWRERGSFNTVALTAFYDIHTQLPTLLGMTITSRQAIAAMQYRLLEPATPTVWSGSAEFTLADLTSALQYRRNQFLLDTGAIATRTTMPAAPVPIYREVLDEAIIDVLRVTWINADGYYTNLRRTNELLVTAYSPRWTLAPGDPKTFSTIISPPVTLQIAPPPLDLGTLELIVVQSPVSIDPATNTLVYIPDDTVWIPQWGAISDLMLREGEAKDTVRGQYARMRYEHGARATMLRSPILQYEIQGVITLPATIDDLDLYKPGWQNLVDVPTALGKIGRNLVGASPVPVGIHSIVMDVLRNAPVPVADADFLQVGRQDLNTIMDYCVHLAAFKLGGQEFLSTLPLLESFLKQAAAYNSRLSELDGLIHTYMQTLPSISPEAVPTSVSKDIAAIVEGA